MLCLSRKVGEKVYIGDDIVLTVIDIDRDRQQIRIGVEAPREVPIYRHELLPETHPRADEIRPFDLGDPGA